MRERLIFAYGFKDTEPWPQFAQSLQIDRGSAPYLLWPYLLWLYLLWPQFSQSLQIDWGSAPYPVPLPSITWCIRQCITHEHGTVRVSRHALCNAPCHALCNAPCHELCSAPWPHTRHRHRRILDGHGKQHGADRPRLVRPATLCHPPCNPMSPALQPCVTRPATACDSACNRMCPSLPPYVSQPATVRDPGCYLTCLRSAAWLRPSSLGFEIYAMQVSLTT